MALKKILLTISAVFLGAFAQVAGDPDAWVDSGQMLRFPTGQFFTAVGVGASEQSARENAIIEVKRQISSSVDSRTISTDIQTDTGRITTFSEENQISVSGDIEGVQIVATARRDDNFFAFAALNKERFVASQRLKIHELRNELAENVRLGQVATEQGNVVVAIANFTEALSIIPRIEGERALLSAAATLTADEEIPISQTQVNALIHQVVSGLRISFVGENDVKLYAEEIPTKEIKFNVVLNSKPAQNVPVDLFDDTGRRIANLNSDEDGNIVFFIGNAASTSRGTHRFVARINLSGIKYAAESGFSYTVRTRDLRANISVEVSNDLRGARRDIERAVNNLLLNYGIIDSARSPVNIVVSVSDVLGETIRGVSAARTFVRTDATLLISVSDKDSDRRFSTELSRSGMANNRNAAVIDAIRGLRLMYNIEPIQEIIRQSEPVE